ncbi:MAG: hypothetical protein HZB71_02885 [Betaproteobacteria bacterium]|nr:hypothetical protein [Betaproteobacteria bacterium]
MEFILAKYMIGVVILIAIVVGGTSVDGFTTNKTKIKKSRTILSVTGAVLLLLLIAFIFI